MSEQSKSKRLKRGLLFSTMLAWQVALPALARASGLCEGVAFMPTNLVLTRAKDQAGMRGGGTNGDDLGLVDVHQFGHFYTFQVDRDVNERNEGVVMDLTLETDKAATSEGFALRLRSEFNSAEASRAGMGFEVTLGRKVYDDTGYIIETIAQMSSLNTEEGEGTVAIDIPSLPAGSSYQLRYEFGQKEVLRSEESLSMQEDAISTGDSVITCNLPFFTQELVLIDRKALKTRVKDYNLAIQKEQAKDVTKHPICDFSLVDGERQNGELGLQCNSNSFFYSTKGPKTSGFLQDHAKDSDGFALRTIAEYPFRVSGTKGEPITQLFKMTVGSEFAYAGGLRAVLRRADDSGTKPTQADIKHPFTCLLDQSCQFAWRQSKNHQSFQVVLTTGDYILQLVDLSQTEYTEWLANDVGLTQVPFQVYIESFPILQNEIREHCPYMYLMEEFIQQKFIDGQQGQKFHFADKVVMNLVDLRQEVVIVPELDSQLKVVIREAFGVNAGIKLCEHSSKKGSAEPDCFQTGQQVGTTEILFADDLKRDTQYSIVIDYSHSILAFHKFDTCPHLPVEISMLSQSEAALISTAHKDDTLGVTEKDSRSKLKDISERMSYSQKVLVDDPQEEGRFVLTSKTESAFEVLSSTDFRVDIKMGLYMEVFYSPFDDEVVELYLAERHSLQGHEVQADGTDEYDNDNAANQKTFAMNKFKSAKTLWVDLEAGDYTLQILMKRQPAQARSTTATSYYEKVHFQLYVNYDFVNVSREVFIPGSLNYHGMLGVGDETHDFGHVTLFWDDVTLWHRSLSTLFTLESEMASVSIQLEQPTDLMKVHLSAFDDATGIWQLAGAAYPMVTNVGRIDTVEEFSLIPGTTYKIEVFKDSFSEHAQVENVEMGERYGTSFSLKVDFSEFDERHIAENLQKTFREFLPLSMDQVAKIKRSVLGLHEKSFMMGNRNIIQLIENGDGWQDQVIVPAYVPKDPRIFISKQTEQSVVTSLPFEVIGEAEMVSAGIYEYTQGANLMSLHIIDGETNEEVAISRQGKHLSIIQDAFLPQGSYYLVIKNDRGSNIGAQRAAPLEFALDVVRHQVPEGHDYLLHQLEALELCQLPQLPIQGLTKPGYLHPLGGHSIQQILTVGIQELDSGSSTAFTIDEDSLITIYIETPEDIPVALQIQESGGIRKALALSNDQDRTQSNFLKQEGFVGRSVVQLREFIAKGTYFINAQAINEDVLLNFDSRGGSFCETFTMSINIHPLKTATKTFSPDVEEEFCEETDPLVNQLRLDGMVRGNLVKELTTYSVDVGYFDFDGKSSEGPFMVYFQLDYDVTQEGVVAVVLSQYDKTTALFTEVGLYSLSDSQSTVLQIVERGTYSISIQSIVSTPQKFQQLGLNRQQLLKTPTLQSHCFRGVYTYMVASVNDHDGTLSSIVGMNKDMRVRVMETLDDLRDLREFQTCHHDPMPAHFPISDEGFERQYAFKMSQGGHQAIELIIEEPSLIKVLISLRNPQNQVHAYLHSPGTAMLEEGPIGRTSASDNAMMVTVDPSRKPYLLELVHAEWDSRDPCPVYDFHIAVKPLRYVPIENLMCEGHGLPPHFVEVTQKTTKLDVKCAFTDEMLRAGAGSKGIFDYAVDIDLPHSDYFVDIEVKSDFLTGNMKLQLFAEDDQGLLQKIAQSVWFDELSYEDIEQGAGADLSTKVGDKTMVQKLRYLENLSPEFLDQASKLSLHIKVNTLNVLDALEVTGVYDPRQESLCFNFDLSFFIDEVGNSGEYSGGKNKLIRVDWNGKEQSSGQFDVSGRLNAFVEFEKSLSHHLPALKSSFQEFIYLQPLQADKTKADDSKSHIVPSHFKAKKNSDDTLVLAFDPYTLEPGTCYRLTFKEPSHSGFFSAFFGGGDSGLFDSVSPETKDSSDMTVCTSACTCDVLGTRECLETHTGEHQCICHAHFIGKDCSECEAGFYRNLNGFCEKESLCEHLGGTEDCNRHGQCVQQGKHAVCECDQGFTHDGLDQCGRCSDPLMHYPSECHKRRNWVMQQDDFECQQMKRQMPRVLYKDPQAVSQGGLTNESQVVYQQANGVLEWAGRYALDKTEHSLQKDSPSAAFVKDKSTGFDDKFRKESYHHFFVRETSTYRLHLNTLNSNVKFSYQILDSDNQVLVDEPQVRDAYVGFGMLTPLGDPKAAIQNPFTLLIRYEHEHEKHGSSDLPECPKIEVHMVVEPAHFHVESLECSPREMRDSANHPLTLRYAFTGSHHVSEHNVVMPDHWLREKNAIPDVTPFTFRSDEDGKLANIELDLSVERPGVLSAIVASDFSDMHAYISLRKKQSNTLIATEKSYMLDDVEFQSEHYGETSDVSVARNHDQWDHIQAIEVKNLAKGDYTLVISIPKAFWFPNRDLTTCLSFDFVLEFVPKDTLANEEFDFLDSFKGQGNGAARPIQVISVFPPGREDLHLGKELSLFVNFDAAFDPRQAASKLPELSHLCRLRNVEDKKQFITPSKYFYDSDTVKLGFDFARDVTQLQRVFKENSQRPSSACWTLHCKDQPIGAGDLYFTNSVDPHKYCFADLANESVFTERVKLCNPFAKSKPGLDGKPCKCAPPYTGEQCEQCILGYQGFPQDTQVDGRVEQHTVCVPVDGSDEFECNGFGRFDSYSQVCDCEDGFAGNYCEMCEDAQFEYPDCHGLMMASFMDDQAYLAFNQRRYEQAYHKDYHLENAHATSPFQQQCPYTDFPNHLNSIAEHKQFVSGDFHVADFYTVNHSEDNVIEWTPKNKGLFKVMLKQPELESATLAEETMHLEVGITPANGASAMVSTANHFMHFDRDGNSAGALIDFAVLEFEVTQELISEPLLIFFRGVNQTHDSGYMGPQLCAQLFIEIEFRAFYNMHKCENTYPELAGSKALQQLSQGETWPAEEQVSTLEITRYAHEKPFFYSQDFFLKNGGVAEHDLEVQLAQKFIDQHLIIPVVEILELGLASEADFDVAMHPVGESPVCETECLVAGHKIYNAFTVTTYAPAGSVLRVWLYQDPALNPVKLLGKNHEESCVNFALQVRSLEQMSSEHEEQLKENLVCEHTRYLPRSFNRLRYLGDFTEGGDSSAMEQQDFNYVEHFRVDNLQHEGRKTDFTLKELTLVRIDGIEHESIQFYVSIHKGSVQMASMTSARLPGTGTKLVPAIFQVLEPGTYSMKVEFVPREAELLREPCQSIQMQIAMNRADPEHLYPRETPSDAQISNISLQTITASQDMHFEAKVMSYGDQEEMFQVLYDEVVVFEDRDDLNLAMKVSSDFVRADVNFVLIHLDSGHHFMAQHVFEDGKKMTVPELPPGAFRIIVFTQNVQQAPSSKVTFQPIVYSFSFKVFSFIQRDQTFIYPAALNYDGQVIDVAEPAQVLMPFSTPEKLACYGSGRRLPENLTQDVLLHETDFEFRFAIYGPDLAFINDHVIYYKPEAGEDVLRVQVDTGVQAKIFKQSDFDRDHETARVLHKSHDKLGNGIHEMVAVGLLDTQWYAIQIIFAPSPDDFAEKAQFECLIATMQVKIANSNSEYVCLDQSKSAQLKKVEGQKMPQTLSYKSLTDKGKHIKMVAATDTAPTFIIDIQDDNTDLEVSIEESDHLYGATVQLIPQTHSELKEMGSASDRGMSKLLGQIFGDRHAIEPVHMASPKHQTKVRFMDLAADKYVVRLIQPAKPSDCINAIDVLFLVSQSLDSRLVEKFATKQTVQLRYQSKLEMSDKGVFVLPTFLPLALDSYRLLQGGSTEEQYSLISDTYLLGDKEDNNVFTLTNVQGNDTYVRFHTEDATLLYKVTCVEHGGSEIKFNATYQRSFFEQDLPQGTDCKIFLRHTHVNDHERRLFLNEKVRITALVASRAFVDTKYKDFHKSGLQACPTNQWPLALQKNTELMTNSDEQSYYSYPMVRYPLQGLFGSGFPVEMNSYYFRFNETQRVYFEVGSNFVTSHATLKLSPSQRAFGSLDIMGKQRGNTNVIDQDVPPGDYKLTILVYKGESQTDCGIFSMKGILNMHSAMSEHLPGASPLIRGSTLCEIRNSEEAPGQIFASEDKTRKGNEAVIDAQGNFFRYYPDILVVKTHASVLEPWTHEVLVDVPETSFVQVIMSSEEAENMIVKVYHKLGGAEVTPAVTTMSNTNSPIQERKAIFKLLKGSYEVVLEFAGDIYNEFGEEQPCAYFDLTLAINSLRSLSSKLSCTAQEEIDSAQSLLKALPKELSSNNLDFTIDSFYTFRYPADFTQTRFKSNGKDSYSLMLPTVLDIQSPFSVSASIGFDVFMADFEMELVMYDSGALSHEQEGIPHYEMIEKSTPLINLASNDDETFMRSLSNVFVDPSEDLSERDGARAGDIKYLFVLEEKHSFYLYNEVAKASGKEDLCLPFIFKFKVTSGHDQAHASMLQRVEEADNQSAINKPLVVDFKFFEQEHEAHAQHHFVVPFNVQRLTAGILLTQKPRDDTFLRSKAFTLAFVADDRVEEVFRPVQTEIAPVNHHGDELYQVVISFKVDLAGMRHMINDAEELALQLQIDTEGLYSKESGDKFRIFEETVDKLFEFSIFVQVPEDLRVQAEARARLAGAAIHDSLADAIGEMHAIKSTGTHYPPELEQTLAKMANSDITNMSPEALAQMATTIQNIASHHQQLGAEIAAVAPVKCQCVHGTCTDGEATCNKCYNGWHGRLCDIADDEESVKPSARAGRGGKPAKHTRQVVDDESDPEMFRSRKIPDQIDERYEAPAGRRFNSNKRGSDSDDYKPRMSYHSQTITDLDGLEADDDFIRPSGGSSLMATHQQRSRGTKAKVITDDEDEYESSSHAYNSHRKPSSPYSVQTASQSSQPTYTQTSAPQNTPDEPGFFKSLFFGFVWLVKWLVYIAVGSVCLYLLKACFEGVREKMQAAKQKKRKGKRKRQSELTEDGMGLAGGAGLSEGEEDGNGDDDSDGSPIEMTLVNRKHKDGLRRQNEQSRRRRQGSMTGSEESKSLQLFEEDEDEDRGIDEETGALTQKHEPQEVATAKPTAAATEYNPFDDEAAPQELIQMTPDVEGQVMLNEIDDALASDDDEFGDFA